MSAPKVSIIMPSLNVAPYIRECIESAVNQTLKEIEIICVDAGSTDGTLEILQEYAEKDSRIRLIHSDMKSYGHQMNLGFDAATGEYMGILETDDYILPEMYEEMYDLAKKNNLDIIKGDHEIFVGDSGNRTYTYQNRCKNIYYKRVLDPQTTPNVFNAQMHTWAGIYSMNFLRENHIRHNETPGASYQDNGFWFQTFMFARRIWFVNKPYYYLRRDNPNSSVKNRGKVFCIFEEYAFVEEILRRHPDLEKKFIGMFHKKKMDNCLFHYSRVADEYKRDFLDRLSEEFCQARVAGELDQSLFYPESYNNLCLIMDSPELFYLLSLDVELELLSPKQQNLVLNHKMNCLMEELNNIKSGTSFRIGRAITAPLRAIRWAIERIYSNTITRIR